MTQRRHPSVFLLMGAPGTGKGTQAAFLSKALNMTSLSTGEMLRAEAKRNSSAGFRVRQILASGALVPDELVCHVVELRLRSRHEISEGGVILDGFPRTVSQARFLDSLLEELGLSRPTVVHLQVAKNVLLKRLTSRRQCARCGAIYNLISRPSKKGRHCEIDAGVLVQREDDCEGVILKRFAEYEAMSRPLIDYYSGPNYHAVNGAREVEEIARELLDSICLAAMAA